MNLKRHLQGLASSLRPRLSQPSYREDSTDEDNAPAPRRSLRSQRNKRPQHDDGSRTSSRPQKRRRTSPPKYSTHAQTTMAQIAPATPASPASPVSPVIPSKIPPWQTLPYQILVDIFQYASYPLYDNFFRPNSSIHWLLDSATICKSFSEPALAALYFSPPLMPQFRSHKLLHFLSTPHENIEFYTKKIHRIELEVCSGLLTKGGSRGYFDLAGLLRKTPQLKELHLYNYNDRVQNVHGLLNSTRAGRWGYPQPLFDTLDDEGIKLRTFEWNGSFSEPKHLLEEIAKVHQRSSFQKLKELTFVDFYLAHRNSPSYQQQEGILGATVKYLQDLSRLKFQNCSLVTENLLPMLPQHLESLTFDNCDNLSSVNLRPFLSTHGSQLRQLMLNHNSSLNLSFLVDLATSCPKLEVLKMDLQFFSKLSVTNESDPCFDQLLLPSEVPTWPSTLQIIDFNQLRKWEAEAAQVFFGSLLDSARNLQALRKLTVKAMVNNISWRDRARFREFWISRFERVFLRQSSAPDQSLSSLSAYQEFHDNLKKSMAGKDKERSHRRRSCRIAQREEDDLKSVSFKSHHSQGSQSSLRQTREQSPDVADAPLVHGMCDSVTVRIDGMRPAENILTESDFLDSEISGDEDWDGADVHATEGYAW